VKIKLKLLFATLAAILTFNAALAQTAAQKKDTINVGEVTGLVRDSLHNYVMQAATLAIYKVQDKELVSYQLTNNYGKYQFKLVPVGIPLRIIATYIGYQSSMAEFTISPKTKAVELKTINMERVEHSLNEVVITAAAAPMQMRGDTLEFNASAFKLDTNAVIEDLLRKLPGVTIWGDGAITVNGKTISRLLVDGKEFFGGDNRIALQNIQKNAVQKVQVYQNKQDPDPISPKTEMNIVLKKSKKDGFFGKFGLGGGTQDHYAGDAMMTYFSPKTQVAVAGAYNNVNKTAYYVNTLMNFNSFKGEGINNDYHTDFTQPGSNTFKGGGFTVSQDFTKDSDTRQSYYKTNNLRGEYFLRDAANSTLRQSMSTIQLSTGNIVQQSDNNSTNNEVSQRGNVTYNKRFLHGSLMGSVNYSSGNTTSASNTTNTSINVNNGNQSLNLQQSNSTSSTRHLSGDVTFSTERYWDNAKQKQRSLNTNINYRFDINDADRDSKNITDLKATDITQNKYINRRYLNDNTSASHTITTTVNGINGLLQRRSPFIIIDFKNMLEIKDYKENNNVSDILAGNPDYTPNAGLTNITHLKTINERPGLQFIKSFNKGLDNRYSKNWDLRLTAENQFFMQRNSALQLFQNINRNYSYFIPSATFRYSNYQYGANSQTYSLGYNTSVNFPEISQLAPLNDNANVYSLQIGNLRLKPSYDHKVSFNYDYYGLTTKNPFRWQLSASAGVIKNNMSDSSNYDNTGVVGRYVRSTINLGDRKYFSLSGSVDKALNLKDHQFSFNARPVTNYYRYLLNLNGQTRETKTQTLNVSTTLNYTYKSIWSASFGESFEGNKTEQLGLNKSSYYKWTTNAGFAFAFPRSVFFNTRVNFNNTKSSGQTDNVYFTIWNADVGYRFLKGNDAEIKFSVLDILHQNKAVYNSVFNNVITSSSNNVLQQYFMLTLAYYPRKFGLKK